MSQELNTKLIDEAAEMVGRIDAVNDIERCAAFRKLSYLRDRVCVGRMTCDTCCELAACIDSINSILMVCAEGERSVAA